MEYQTHYERLGGAPAIRKLVFHFYNLVEKHPVLKPIFPDDLTETRQKQYWFLTQFFGGPPLYTEKRGHPMMRRRHLEFPIDQKAVDAWLSCMSQALDKLELDPKLREEVWTRFVFTAHHMKNID